MSLLRVSKGKTEKPTEEIGSNEKEVNPGECRMQRYHRKRELNGERNMGRERRAQEGKEKTEWRGKNGKP